MNDLLKAYKSCCFSKGEKFEMHDKNLGVDTAERSVGLLLYGFLQQSDIYR